VLSLPEAARSSRAEADAILRRARSNGMPIEELAAARGISAATVPFWFPDALRPRRHGQTRVKPADRQLRVRTFISGDKRVFVAVRGSRVADAAAEANAVQWLYVHGKAKRSELERFADVRIGGYSVQVDADALVEVARRGEFDPEDLYRELFT
jgi:hypothetical protein